MLLTLFELVQLLLQVGYSSLSLYYILLLLGTAGKSLINYSYHMVSVNSKLRAQVMAAGAKVVLTRPRKAPEPHGPTIEVDALAIKMHHYPQRPGYHAGEAVLL